VKTSNKGGEMKKLMALLVVFAVILLAGGLKNSLAQDGQSVLSRYAFSDDSLKALSLQANAEKHFVYVEPGPANPGKVVGEFIAGGIGAAAFGYIGARVGWNLTYVEHQSDGWFDLNFSGMPGAIAGYFLLSNLGCAAGVSLVGNTGGERGSYGASLGGGFAGTLLGGLCAIGIASASEWESAWAPAVVLIAAQAGGATMGFNASRKKKVEVPSGAMLNLKDGKLTLALPEVNAYPDSFGSANLRIDLFQANF
jgi:hypothetical protein